MLDKVLTKEILGPVIIAIVSFIIYAICKAIIKRIFKFKVRGVDSKKQKTINQERVCEFVHDRNRPRHFRREAAAG